MNIFSEMFHSLWDFKSYERFLDNRKGKVFLYGLVVSLLVFLAGLVFPYVKFQVQTGGFGHLLDTYVPDFELSDDGLWLERSFHYEEDGIYVDINTDEDQLLNDYDDPAIQEVLDSNESAMLADREKLYLKNNGEKQWVYFDEITDGSVFTKESLEALVPMLNGIITVVMVVLMLFVVAGYFLGALFTALAGLVIASALKQPLGFGKLFLLSIYARTLPGAIKILIGLTGFGIPFLWLIGFILSVVYLYLAINGMKRSREVPELVEGQSV